jgi:hypothetical protein
LHRLVCGAHPLSGSRSLRHGKAEPAGSTSPASPPSVSTIADARPFAGAISRSRPQWLGPQPNSPCRGRRIHEPARRTRRAAAGQVRHQVHMAERFVLDSAGLQANRGFGRVRHTRAGARRACRQYVAIANADTAPRRNVWREKAVMGRILHRPRVRKSGVAARVTAQCGVDRPRSAGPTHPGSRPLTDIPAARRARNA